MTTAKPAETWTWDDYLNQSVADSSGCIDNAIIIDGAGQTIWGKSSNTDNLELTPAEVNVFASFFNEPSGGKLYDVGSKKYRIMRMIESEVPIMFSLLANGKEGIVAAKCTNGILIAHHPDTVVSPQAVDFLNGEAKKYIGRGM